MKKLDKRVEINKRSIAALKTLLQEVVNKPAIFIKDNALCRALNSQGSLSQYVNKSRSIVAMSLNTTKRISECILEQGFASIDRLRMTAKEAINNYEEKENKSNKTTRPGLIKRVSELEMENQALKEDLLLLSALLEQSMQQAKSYAERSGIQTLMQLSQKEQRELKAKLCLRNNNVVMFKNKV